jgi:hypothetical protein
VISTSKEACRDYTEKSAQLDKNENLLFRSQFCVISLGRKRSLNYDIVTGFFTD